MRKTILSLAVVGAALANGAQAQTVVGPIDYRNLATVLASPPAIGGTTAAAGSFTTLSASSTVSGAGITSLFASPPAIGGTTAAAGAFTSLSASGTVSGVGFSTYLASPPAIGGTAAAAGSFTTLTASGLTTLNGLEAVSVGDGLTAAGTTQATALALTANVNVVTTTASGSGVILPTTLGAQIEVINRGANALLVYPPGTASIDGGTASAGVSVAANAKIRVVCSTSTTCYSE